MIGNTFIEKFSTMDERQKRLLTETLQDLFSHCYIVRGALLRSNPKYVYLERNEELVSDYLAISGYRLQIDRDQGVARFFHPEGSGRIHFNKEETLFILLCRLFYHEQKQAASEISDVVVKVGLVKERLHNYLSAQTIKPIFSAKNIGRILRKFEQMRLISFVGSSFQINDDTEFFVLTSIEHLVSQQSIEQTISRIHALLKVEEKHETTD